MFYIHLHTMINIILPILFFFSVQANALQFGLSDVHLSSKEISLENRNNVNYVNDVFKDNILLNLWYMQGKKIDARDVKWDEITKPFTFSFTLLPGKTFAFHEDVLPEFKDRVTATTNTHFNFAEGFKSDGYLVGDGVCHLASLIYWAAKEADLDAYAPTNHNFMEIPEVPKNFGVSIYNMPGNPQAGAIQNLYITNNRKKPIVFKFHYMNSNLKLSIYEEA